MGLLLDTHIWIWFKMGASQLKQREIEQILHAHAQNKLFISTISIWEVAMLQKHGRLALHQPINQWLKTATKGIQQLPISTEIALESVLLPNLNHKDPADRFILATSRILSLTLLTHDVILLDYVNLGYLPG